MLVPLEINLTDMATVTTSPMSDSDTPIHISSINSPLRNDQRAFWL
jgi:hypothetical protein